MTGRGSAVASSASRFDSPELRKNAPTVSLSGSCRAAEGHAETDATTSLLTLTPAYHHATGLNRVKRGVVAACGSHPARWRHRDAPSTPPGPPWLRAGV